MLREKPITTLPGALVLVLIIATFVGATMWIIQLARVNEPGMIWMPILLILLAAISIAGLFVVNPNDGQAVLLFGDYLGTARSQGFHWVNPFTTRMRVSMRIRNFEGAKLKVNDHTGNPIEIAAVVVWKVVDTAEALFEVDDYKNFVQVQSEAALRNLATSYPYDAHVEGEMSLRSHTAEIAEKLKGEVQDRLAKAGVEVLETRISHLAYAPEIASAMLQRQQASAVVAARSRIVEGAVGMVEMALAELQKKGIVELDAERKAAMVSNLLVVLCSDRHTQPVVNTGTLYQ
jgi:regulator of protease activity HflC (stomatin/prohibitin superfamily)